MSLDCAIYCAFYSILFRGAVFPGHGVDSQMPVIVIMITVSDVLWWLTRRVSYSLARMRAVRAWRRSAVKRISPVWPVRWRRPITAQVPSTWRWPRRRRRWLWNQTAPTMSRRRSPSLTSSPLSPTYALWSPRYLSLPASVRPVMLTFSV